MNPIPVLMYHHVNPHKGDMFTVTPEIFKSQMEYLANAGYKALSLDELYAYINKELDLKQKAVVITFDDGWLDNYIYAFPVIEKYKLQANFFLVTDWVEKSSEKFDCVPKFFPKNEESKTLVRKGQENKVIITWDIIKKMEDSGLIGFFSHTKSHFDCSSLSETDIMVELKDSKRIIEERLKKPCSYLCWPHGFYNETAISIAKKIGYIAIFTIERGAVTVGSNSFSIKRNNVEDNVLRFKQRMRIYTHSALHRLYEFYLRIKLR